MSDLDERLGRYARHLDEHVTRFEVPTGDTPPRVLDLEAGRSISSPPPTRHRAWLAAAAALCLIVAGSLAWWRSVPTDPVGGPDTTEVTTEPNPDGRIDETPDPAAPITWQRIERGFGGGWGVPVAATSFRGGLLAVSGNGLFKPLSWWSADGQRLEEERVMSEDGGTPKAIAADDSVAVAVGNGPGEARAWITTDGRTWDTAPLAGADSIEDLARTPFGFIAVGSSLARVDGVPLDDPQPAAWVSADGRSWARATIPDLGAGTLRGVAASSDTMVLVGETGGAPYAQSFGGPTEAEQVWRSIAPELASPTSTPPAGGSLISVAWVGDRFLTIGDGAASGAVWATAGDSAFTPVPLGPLAVDPATSVGFTDVTGTDGTAVVIADAGPDAPLEASSVLALTDDGEWSHVAPIEGFPVRFTWLGGGDGRLLALAADSGVFVGTLT